MTNKTYLLLLKADEFLRDRCVVAGTRAFRGPVVGMAPLPALPKNRYFDHVLPGDPHSPESALRAVERFEQSHGMRPSAVIPVTEMSLASAQAIAAHYSLPFLSRESVIRARDKRQMKAAFNASGVPTARHEIFHDLASLQSAVAKLGLPVIIKPATAAHSIGVMRIDEEKDIPAAYAFCRSNLDTVKQAWNIDDTHFLAEEYIDADREVSVEVVNTTKGRHVIAVTEKYLTPPPFFAEVGHMVPSRDEDTTELAAVALKACDALQLDHGVSHVEMRITASGAPFVVEVAARPGGDGIMDLVERAYGVNMYGLHIASYLGQDVTVPSLELRGVAAIAFMQAAPGKVRQVSPPRQLPDEVVSLYLTARVGSEVGKSLNYDDRLGTVELFWPGATRNLGRLHLETAQRLADEIFVID